MCFSARTLAFALTAAAVTAGCGGRAGTAFVPGQVIGRAPSRQSATRAAATPWIPAAQTTFAIQYGGAKLDTRVKAATYDVDGFDTTASTVAALHAKGRHVVCYIDVGAWEKWRPDAHKFPKSILGKPDGGWPGERWLDIRQLSVLEPIMSARFHICKEKGFDAVDPDNIDGYQNRTGFKLTGPEQIAYDRWGG